MDTNLADLPLDPNGGETLVYVVRTKDYQIGDAWPTKIGRTQDIASRLSQLQTGNFMDLELVYELQGADSVKLEAAFHRMFAGKKLRGEWFLLDQHDFVFLTWATLECAFNVIMSAMTVIAEFGDQEAKDRVTYLLHDLNEAFAEVRNG